MSAIVTVYSRPGLPPLRGGDDRLRAAAGASSASSCSERDIDGDEALQRAYFERIPVVALDGEELFDYFVDEALLRERLESRQ